MQPVALLVIAAVAVSIGAMTWFIASVPDPTRGRTSQNLFRGITAEEAAAQASGSVTNVRRQSVAGRLVTKRNRTWQEKLVARAGFPKAWPIERIATVKVALAALAIMLGLLWVTSARTPLSVGLSIALVAVAYFLPEILLYQTATSRSEAITLELADTIDQMSIAVEAGLGFEAAMNRVARNGKGILAEELLRTLQDIQAGETKADAYNGLSERANVPDLTRFVRAIVRAESYGLAMSGVLRTQATEMRTKRRQRAEEKAQQIPVKVVMPLIVCILPVLFIIVLGPAAIQIMTILTK